MKKYLFAIIIFGVNALTAQTSFIRNMKALEENSWVSSIAFDTYFSPKGTMRVVDMAMDQKGTQILLAIENAGLWKSDNSGVSYSHIFDNQHTQNVTAVALDEKNHRIWVATDRGIFRSEDNGKTWSYSGLFQARNITAIHVSNKDDKTLLVSVLGDETTKDDLRGVFKTTDLGKNWQKTLYAGDRTGVVSLVASKGDAIYAVSWERNDTPWFTDPTGKTSGIYRSDDDGKTWNLLTGEKSGFAQGKYIGRIGLTEHLSELYAVVDNRTFLPTFSSEDKSLEKKHHIILTASDLEEMSPSDFTSLDASRLEAFIHAYNLQDRYTVQTLKNLVRYQGVKPSQLMRYLDISPDVVAGVEIYKSSDRGNSWQKLSAPVMLDVYYREGHRFGAIMSADRHIVMGGFPLLSSEDGVHWQCMYINDFSVPMERLWKSPDGKRWFVSDGKELLCFTDFGKAQLPMGLPPIGQLSGVVFANDEVYVWSPDQTYRINTKEFGIQQQSKGGENAVVTSDREIFFTGKYGDVSRLDLSSNEVSYRNVEEYSPQPLRFNAQPPLAMMPQNPKIMFLGSQYLHMSVDAGMHWKTISSDLTAGDKKGNRAYGTLTSIAVSPLDVGLIYTGSDDGKLYRSSQMGADWQLIYQDAQAFRVSSVVASAHKKTRVYATLYKAHKPLVFRSEDQGKSWTNINSDLPSTGVNFIAEDPHNASLLYVGTENGLFVSFDEGERWHLFSKGIPQTSVTAMAFDVSSQHIWVTTSMLGVYVADVSVLSKLKAFVQNQEFYSLREKTVLKYAQNIGNQWTSWKKPDLSGVSFDIFASQPLMLKVRIMKEGIALKTFDYPLKRGFNRVPYDLTQEDKARVAYEQKIRKIVNKKATNGVYYLPKGVYEVEFSTPTHQELHQLEIQ